VKIQQLFEDSELSRERTLEIFHRYFFTLGTVSVNSSHEIDVDGDVRFDSRRDRLPVKFGHVSGDFKISNTHLVTLANSPRSVSGEFNCSGNQLASLTGAPDSVGAIDCIGNPLTSLDGFPSQIQNWAALLYDQNLPLMRLLNAPRIMLFPRPQMEKIQQILNRHAGLGKRGMMKCTSELLTLGAKLGLDLRANCRW
jgi:hypothetical protein